MEQCKTCGRGMRPRRNLHRDECIYCRRGLKQPRLVCACGRKIYSGAPGEKQCASCRPKRSRYISVATLLKRTPYKPEEQVFATPINFYDAMCRQAK